MKLTFSKKWYVDAQILQQRKCIKGVYKLNLNKNVLNILKLRKNLETKFTRNLNL